MITQNQWKNKFINFLTITTMKKIFFLLLFFIGVLATFVAFHACTSDEVDEQSVTDSQLLMQKSKEFAKKYGVNLALDPNKLNEASKNLTIEQMEQIYKDWAAFNSIKLIDTENNRVVSSKNGIKIRRRVETKEVTPVKGGYMFKCEGTYKEAPVEADLSVYDKGNGHIVVYIYSKMIHDLISSGSGDFDDIQGNYDSEGPYNLTGKTQVYFNGISHYFTGMKIVRFSCSPGAHVVSISNN